MISLLNTLILSLMVLFFALISSDAANAQDCAPELQPVDNWKIKYKMRGSRCEGFYRSNVSSRSLEIVGLTIGKFRFKLDKREVIEVSSPVVKNRPVFVRAVGIPIKSYYRMDAKIDPGEFLNWPIRDVIEPQKLSFRKIGVYGWFEDKEERIYAPVRTSAKFVKEDLDNIIRMYLRASVDVESVKWRWVDGLNDLPSTLIKWNNAPRSSYRIGKPILIQLPRGKTGNLFVETAARESESGEWLKQTFRMITVGGPAN